MRVEVQSALIGAFVTVAVMTGMLLRLRRRRSDLLFAVFCVTLVAWFLAFFLRGTFGDDPWLRVELAIAALVPAAMVRLFVDLLPWTARPTLRNVAYPTSVLFALAALSPIGDLEIVQASVGVYVGVIVLASARRMIAAGDLGQGTVEHARRRYLAFAAVVVTLMAILGELPPIRGSFTAISHLTVMLYVFFLSQVILRDRLLDLNEFVGRMAVLAILAVLFAGISALLISLGNNASSRLFNAVVGVIILLTLYDPLKDRLETKVVELFFRERYRFIQVLEDLRRRMQHGVLDPAKMSQIVSDTLYDSRRATHVAVYLLEPMGNSFRVHAYRGPEPSSRVDARELPELWHAIQQNRAPILAEQLAGGKEQAPDAATKRDLIDAMRAVSADMLFPFVSGESVLGFLALRDDRSVEPYSTAEIAGLMKIAETAATVIWNSKLAERLRERERLAAIGSMAAGLAHEIRNPLGAIKGAAEYLDPSAYQKQEQGELLQVIIDETNRLNSVVSQFLDYARPFRANLQATDVNELLKKTAKLLEAQKGEQSGGLILDLDDRLPTITADSEQIKQVLINLIINGREASQGSGKDVTVATRYLPERGLIEVRIKDQGVGIPPEDLEKIFIPFFTTKPQGTGLGLAVCQRIVMNHNGIIYPESKVGAGTEFVIQLPVQPKELISTTGSFSRPRAGSKVSPSVDLPAPPPAPKSEG
ncbi:MAG: hypothetical protein IPG45_34655 [Deltaproteobacteria bacterium]|nr:hypothetical protein [Deltaproteobacteria bacterium]